MLHTLEVENLKSFKKASIGIAPTTVLIGENGSGKSTFLQILCLLKQNYNQQYLNDGQLVRAGGFHNLASDPSSPIKIKLVGSIRPKISGPYGYLSELEYVIGAEFNETGNYSLQLKLAINNPNPVLLSKLGRTSGVIVDQHRIGGRHERDEESFFYDERSGAFYDGVRIAIVEEGNNFRPELQTASIKGNLPYEITNGIGHTLAAINAEIKREFDRIVYVPALRGVDTSEYLLLDDDIKEFVDSSNFNRQAQQMLTSLVYNKGLEEEISSHVLKILGRKFQARVIPRRLVSAEFRNGDRWINIMNEGFGANPLIHLISQLVISPKGSIILIEEPEVHLFPAAQKRLVESILEIARRDGKQLIMTTHSIDVLYPFLAAIRKGKSADKVYFLERDFSNGSTAIQEVGSNNMPGILKEFQSTTRDEIADLMELSGMG